MTSDKKTVEVLYENSSTVQAIPFETFRRDCVNFWVLAGPIPKAPSWIQEGVQFEFNHSNPDPSVREVKGFVRTSAPFGPRPLITSMPAGFTSGVFFKIRSIRYDFVSCEIIKGDGKMFLFPLWDLIRNGFTRTTAWDRLDSDDLVEN